MQQQRAVSGVVKAEPSSQKQCQSFGKLNMLLWLEVWSTPRGMASLVSFVACHPSTHAAIDTYHFRCVARADRAVLGWSPSTDLLQSSNLWLDLPLIRLVLSIFSHPLNSSAPISGMYVSFGQLSLHIYGGY